MQLRYESYMIRAGRGLAALRVGLYSLVAASGSAVVFGTYTCLDTWWSSPDIPWSRTDNPAVTLYYRGMLRHAAPGNTGASLINGSNSMKVTSEQAGGSS